MNFKRLILSCFAILSISSYANYRYEYIAPATESGRTCATKYMTTKQVCYNAMGHQPQNNANVCHQQNNYSYQAYVNRAHSYDDVKKCNPNPQYCPANPNYWNCDESYRQCFATFGGTVNVFKNE